jgi:SAM-dependent methyltransferase
MITLTPFVENLLDNGTIVCPKCHAPIKKSDNHLKCSNDGCSLEIDLIQNKIPILVDFTKDTVLNKEALLATKGESLIPRTDSRNSLPKRILWGEGVKTKENLGMFLKNLPKVTGRNPIVLVIGGGAIGRGTEELFSRSDIDTLSFDIYASPNTHFIADGHDIPIADGSIDGVWIQAVLEHVFYPQKVAAEIFRVLQRNGIVYAETPFLQNVHEGPYDFTRFTESGHRLLFSRFSRLDSGFLNGIGTVLLWNLRYLFWGITRSKQLATLLIFPVFWIRFLEKLVPKGINVDSASGVYFLGKKQETDQVSAKEMIAHYQGYQT